MELPALPPKIQIPVAVRMLEQYGHDITLCPKCKTGKLQLIAIVYPAEKFVKLSLTDAAQQPAALQNKASPPASP